MKGLLRRAAAVLLMAVLSVAAIAGCTKGKAANAGGAGSMFGIIKSAQQVEKKTYEFNITSDIAGSSADIKLSGVSDGSATSLSAEISASGMSFKLDNAVVYTDDAIYLNVASVMEELGSFAEAMNGQKLDLAELGITSDWVSFESEGMFKQDKTAFDTIYSDLDEAYADIITEKDGTYSITVSDKDSVQKLIDATKGLIDNNGDEWAKLMADQYNKIDMKKVVEDLSNQVLDAVVKAYEEATGEKLTDEQIAELKDSMMEEMDLSDVEEVNEDTYKEMFAELKEQLADAEAEDIDGTIDMRTSYSKGVYTFKATAEPNDEEAGSMTCVGTITEDKSAKVEVPSDAQSLIDIIAAIAASQAVEQ